MDEYLTFSIALKHPWSLTKICRLGKWSRQFYCEQPAAPFVNVTKADVLSAADFELLHSQCDECASFVFSNCTYFLILHPLYCSNKRNKTQTQFHLFSVASRLSFCVTIPHICLNDPLRPFPNILLIHNTQENPSLLQKPSSVSWSHPRSEEGMSLSKEIAQKASSPPITCTVAHIWRNTWSRKLRNHENLNCIGSLYDWCEGSGSTYCKESPCQLQLQRDYQAVTSCPKE